MVVVAMRYRIMLPRSAHVDYCGRVDRHQRVDCEV